MGRFVRTTLVGGVIFLLPMLLIGVLLRHGLRLAERVAQPVMGLFPERIGDRVAVADVAAVAVLLAVAFAAGIVARTSAGRHVMRWFENSLIGSLPQFNFVRGIAESIGETQTIEVVLVPTDAGWNLAFVVEPSPGPWVAVFVPGAPEWTSGAVVWAHIDNIRPADVSFAHAVLVLRKLGAGSASIAAALGATHPDALNVDDGSERCRIGD